MKVYLDDNRETPEGWMRAYTVEATIYLLSTRQVESLSLDNDLGEENQEGYKVLDWLEKSIYEDATFPLPEMIVHSSNAARVEYMQRAIQSIQRIRQRQLGLEL